MPIVHQSRIEYFGYVIEFTLFPVKFSFESSGAAYAKDVQSFLGLSGYFRKFIKSYAIKARPLSDMPRKENLFQFNTRERESFQQLKSDLSNS